MGPSPTLIHFCAYFELQKQPKKVKSAKGEFIVKYGSYTFVPNRTLAGDRLEMSYYQKNKWDRDWMKLWFYVKTSSSVHTLDDGSAVTIFSYMLEMKEMKPLLKFDPPATLSDK